MVNRTWYRIFLWRFFTIAHKLATDPFTYTHHFNLNRVTQLNVYKTEQVRTRTTTKSLPELIVNWRKTSVSADEKRDLKQQFFWMYYVSSLFWLLGFCWIYPGNFICSVWKLQLLERKATLPNSRAQTGLIIFI